MWIRRTFALATAFAALFVSAPARASEPSAPKTNLFGLVEDSSRFFTASLIGLAPPERPPASHENGASNNTPASPPPLVDFAPRASIVARDWRGSLRVAGRTILLDDLRPSASHRMILARVASDARLSPFVQVGAGHWRIDPVLFPNMPSRTELAGQVGAGFELRTGIGFDVAGEAGYWFLYRDGGPTTSDAPRLFTALFAAQTSW